MSLDQLLAEARQRALTADEQAKLAEHAANGGPAAVSAAIGQLLQGGRFGALNLRHAHALRALQATRNPTAEDFREIKSADRASVSTVGTQTGFRVTFSNHAVERYVERCANDGVRVTAEDVVAQLTAEAEHATPLKAKTINGDEQWKCPSGAILVVRRDGSGLPAVCTTILAASCAAMRMRGRKYER